MPKRQYHNLDGLLRDGLACFAAEGDEAAWERLVALARFIADVLDVLDDDDSDLPDASDGTGGESDADVDLHDSGRSPPVGGPAPGHGPNSPASVAGPSRMDPQVGHDAASQLALGALPGRPGALVRADLRRRAVGGGGARS